jgi:hypothetical protein
VRLRLLAVVALIVGAAVAVGFVVRDRTQTSTTRSGPVPPKHCDPYGPREALKTATDPAAARIVLQPKRTTAAALAALPAPPTQFDTPRRAPVETQTYRIRGVLKRIDWSSDDGDLTAVLSDTTKNGPLIGIEFPDTRCSPASKSRLAPQMRAARNALIRACSWYGDELYRPNGQYVRVEVTGVAFFDVPHDETDFPPPHNYIELHPVLSFRALGPCIRHAGSGGETAAGPLETRVEQPAP